MKNVVMCAIVTAMVLLLASALPARAWGGHGGHQGYGEHYGYSQHYGYGGYGYGFRYGFGGSYGYPTDGSGYPYPSFPFSAPDLRQQQPTVYVQQQFYGCYGEDANAYCGPEQ